MDKHLIVFMILFEVILILGSIYYRKRYIEKISGVKKYGKRMPLGFAQASALLLGFNDITNAIVAEVANFEREGYVEVSIDEFEVKRGVRSNFIFRKLNNPENFERSNEYLFNELLSEGFFSTRDINRERRENPDIFNEKFGKYVNMIERELIDKGVLNKSKENIFIGLVFLLLSVFTFVFSIAIFLEIKIWGITGLILSVLIFVISLNITGLDNPLAKEQRNIYRRLYENLKEGKIDRYRDITDEEKKDIIIFAIAFGLDYKEIIKISDELDMEVLEFIPVFGNIDYKREMNRSLVGNPNGVEPIKILGKK